MEKKDLSKIKWGEIYTCDLGTMKGSVQCWCSPRVGSANEQIELQQSYGCCGSHYIGSQKRRYCFSYPVRNELWTQRTVYGNA